MTTIELEHRKIGKTLNSLASMFNVSQSQIHNIVRNRQWRD